MNLLAKRLGQLAMLSVALFFFSCEDETSIGYPNPNKKFKVTTIEIPLESSVVLLDSIITDNKAVQSYVTLIGNYNDNLTGNVKTTSYIQLMPAFSDPLSGVTEADSVVFFVRLNYYNYGLTADHTEDFSIHEITGERLNTSTEHAYYADYHIPYDEPAIGLSSVRLDAEEMREQYALASDKQDTLVLRSRLAKEYGTFLLQVSREGFKTDTATGGTTRLEKLQKFFLDAKGLAIVGGANSSAVLGLNLASVQSRLNVYYHTASDTLLRVFAFNPASYTKIEVDRSATELAGVPNYQSFEPLSGMRYLQNGAAIATRLDLTKFYDFADADSSKNVVINEARLVINGVESPVGFEAHNSLRLEFLKESGYFWERDIYSDSAAASGYHVEGDGNYFAIQADFPTATAPYALLRYDSEDKTLEGMMTLFVQSLLRKKSINDEINASRVKYLALFPNSPSVAKSVNRTAFHKDNIKLRVTYTRPTQTNPE